jgi:dTDP-4-dehydrorhamnose 3,5-epimerase
MNSLRITALSLAGLNLVECQRRDDTRGYLARIFCANELQAAGWTKPVAQINQTLTSRRGTIRGLHFQRSPHAEMKLVHCFRGEVWDVAVDLRPDSVTYLQWHAEHMSAGELRAILVPEGCAHGFQTLTDDVEMLYVHSASYAPEFEGGLNPIDQTLNIPWPLPIAEVSERDRTHPGLAALLEDSGFR